MEALRERFAAQRRQAEAEKRTRTNTAQVGASISHSDHAERIRMQLRGDGPPHCTGLRAAAVGQGGPRRQGCAFGGTSLRRRDAERILLGLRRVIELDEVRWDV